MWLFNLWQCDRLAFPFTLFAGGASVMCAGVLVLAVQVPDSLFWSSEHLLSVAAWVACS